MRISRGCGKKMYKGNTLNKLEEKQNFRRKCEKVPSSTEYDQYAKTLKLY